MTFFDQNGSPVQYHQWLATYRPSYYLGGTSLGRKVNRRNQSSQFIENQIDALLAQPGQLLQAHLTLALAWKVGAIDHIASTASVVWKPANFPTAMIGGQYKWNFSQSIPYLATNMAGILQQLAANPAYLIDLNLRPMGSGFGATNKLAMQFFITHGGEPIYDRYAHKAALAIDQGTKPGQSVPGYRAVNSWNEYQNFKCLLRRIGFQPHGSMFISRDDDRALWVYGHLFK